REEKPVELREPAAASAPRVVLPSPIIPQTVAPAQSPPSAPPATVGNAGEPKRVRTVTIRPDGTDLTGRPVGGIPPAAQSSASERPASGRAAPARSTGAVRGGNVPLSLDPQVGGGEASTLPTAPPPSVAPPRLASAPPARNA